MMLIGAVNSRRITMTIPEIEKLASKKFCAALMGMYLVSKVPVPEEWLWVQILGITVIAMAQIAVQGYLDKAKP